MGDRRWRRPRAALRLCRAALWLCGLTALSARAQDLPPDELQVNVSGYFDSFNVSVLYPNVTLTRRVGSSTTLTGRYLVDMVTAASIKQNQGTGTSRRGDDEDEGREDDDRALGKRAQAVDAVTAASSRGGGGEGFGGPDDVRHELNAGLTQLVAGRVLAVNGILSKENDYTSATVAGTLTQYLARKNTTLQLGFVLSRDRIYPKTKDWTRTKHVTTFSANLSQVLGRGLLVQLLYSHTRNTGYLADAYKTVTIGAGTFDPVHPGRRLRQAAAARLSYRLGPEASLQAGYRYYWDDWDVTSHTISGTYRRRLSPLATVGLGWRTNLQSRAFFFRPAYPAPEPFMTVDNKLDAGFSNELQLTLTLNGRRDPAAPSFLADDRLQYTLGLNLYQRHTRSPDWFSRRRDLFAVFFNAGIRYRF